MRPGAKLYYTCIHMMKKINTFVLIIFIFCLCNMRFAFSFLKKKGANMKGKCDLEHDSWN